MHNSFIDAWQEIINHIYVCPRFCITISISVPQSSDVNIFTFSSYILNQIEDGVQRLTFSKKIIFIMNV